ncbi:hypothetical protein, partial [Mycolicibacter virginiensis]|uniref:hypothetical protein n=1 Tax=Mycolicibacter virginiensis TaxID=1795032 RepID=UPI0013FD5393
MKAHSKMTIAVLGSAVALVAAGCNGTKEEGPTSTTTTTTMTTTTTTEMAPEPVPGGPGAENPGEPGGPTGGGGPGGGGGQIPGGPTGGGGPGGGGRATGNLTATATGSATTGRPARLARVLSSRPARD